MFENEENKFTNQTIFGSVIVILIAFFIVFHFAIFDFFKKEPQGYPAYKAYKIVYLHVSGKHFEKYITMKPECAKSFKQLAHNGVYFACTQCEDPNVCIDGCTDIISVTCLNK